MNPDLKQQPETQTPVAQAPVVPTPVQQINQAPQEASQSPISASTPQGVKPVKKLNLPQMDKDKIIAAVKAAPRKYKIMAGFVLTLIILLLLASFTKPGKRVVQQLILATPSPLPSVAPIGEVFVPSPYANDPGVLSIESSLSDFEKKLGATVLGEDNLRPPTVDWDINFK